MRVKDIGFNYALLCRDSCHSITTSEAVEQPSSTTQVEYDQIPSESIVCAETANIDVLHHRLCAIPDPKPLDWVGPWDI